VALCLDIDLYNAGAMTAYSLIEKRTVFADECRQLIALLGISKISGDV
jgi:hypothetical protein